MLLIPYQGAEVIYDVTIVLHRGDIVVHSRQLICATENAKETMSL